MKRTQRIGLFGGSFDPVHNGHIKLAGLAKREFKLDKVVFIPAYNPPHKKQKSLASPPRRLRMLSLAIGKRKDFEISRYELNLKKPVFSYQTVEHFAKKYGGAILFFIVGSDSLIDLKNWKKPARILELSDIITGIRKGTKRPGNPAEKRIHLLKEPIPPVSSTIIRKLAGSGAPLKGFVPGNVASYIRKHELYQ